MKLVLFKSLTRDLSVKLGWSRSIIVASSIVCTTLVASSLSGCASPYPVGTLFTGVTMPVSGSEAKYSKSGQSSCTSILGLIAAGDCSIESAAKAGGVTNIKMVDHEAKNVLGLFGRYTTIVKGD